MRTPDQELRLQAEEAKKKRGETAASDPYRQNYHIMAPVGLLNDPNGVIQWNGVYHLFFQWQPFHTGHGAKFWAHVTTKDFVEWKEEEIALAPGEWYDKNGCYSGSAIEKDGRLCLMYTGNVRDEEGNRETYQCLAVSEDGIVFEKKGVVARLPEGYTAHFRDPKVWKKDGAYYMVLGAQTEKLTGSAVLFTSENLTDWTFLGAIAGADSGGLGSFGYMWECPDLFSLDGTDVLLVCPQGLEADGIKYHNSHQAGYFLGRLHTEPPEFKHGEFTELDRGFDFYAAQTLEDDKGRRILFAWMGVPDQHEDKHPTHAYHWIHCLTMPRQLSLSNGRIIQRPLPEMKSRRTDEQKRRLQLNCSSVSLPVKDASRAEVLLEDITCESGFEISIRGAARFIFHQEEGLAVLERTAFSGEEKETRSCAISEVHSVQLFLDASSIELFLNDGEEVFSARYFPFPGNDDVTVTSVGKTEINGSIWTLL
ncbi:sucrose-6-phosphate hydrolase [Bacillus sp. NEAU-CP5]|uniref:sucrose-6-phosphate hydrolase n=1 Tax=Bacillus TaxID=1386 RepID=UPI001CCC65C0|nr:MULTISPECIES: sucrose-6-phosphate hydrolase [Bacillus]MCX3306357.1 sucrose-6-phosphate hydrolase [Bacillus velezensis]MCX8440957.1 sucrose-6-phosphate hydrolase [Bacillus sp. NEAU-CP5]MEC1338538.1 sucrose-6-phosphate hydrolase [Bacillus velezensis]ULH20383.1 sucrose-6-phosphate hydrolase [Bacillus velezensis]WJF81776.1 sucrose-6-phosphate hydrolase [Bacillus velezensis]